MPKSSRKTFRYKHNFHKYINCFELFLKHIQIREITESQKSAYFYHQKGQNKHLNLKRFFK